MTPRSAASPPFFVISLDFELYWGLLGFASLPDYRQNILGVREAIPSMLSLFREYGVHATWATVGFVTFENKRDLLTYAPEVKPEYRDTHDDPYVHLESIGEDEARDPYHYGYSLVRQILDTPGMELGSHTFGHLRCLKPRANANAFRADLCASMAANARFGVNSTTLVFPRNQYDAFHLGEAAAAGFSVFRGNEERRWYRPASGAPQSAPMRTGRVLDAYINVWGHNLCRVSRDDSGMVSVPPSRFLRPVSRGLSTIESVRCRRILDSLRFAADTGGGFHLWWHPHNFSVNTHENILFLRRILDEYRTLHDERGLRSLTMAEAARLYEP